MAPELPVYPGQIVARLARHVEMAAGTADLTLAQYRVLGILSGQSAAASVLAEKLAVSRPSVTGVVDGLVARELVTRTHDPVDRRRISLDLTKQGRTVLAGIDAEIGRRFDDIAGYGPDGGEPLAGLMPWRDALEAYTLARRDGAPRAGSTEKAAG
ncbi:MAG TPA: MarR family transcriptional regulator [Gaiellaceae bacterium]